MKQINISQWSKTNFCHLVNRKANYCFRENERYVRDLNIRIVFRTAKLIRIAYFKVGKNCHVDCVIYSKVWYPSVRF